MPYCADRNDPTGLYCLLKRGHDTEHMSLDNTKMWKGAPGLPVFWPVRAQKSPDATDEIPLDALNPTLTQGEAGIRPRDRQLYSPPTQVPVFNEGAMCTSCGSLNTRRAGSCLICEACGATGECG